jgi:hypothetical protein
MALSGIWDYLQIGGMRLVNDEDITNAVVNCYKNICWNDYKQSTLTNCKLDLTRVGNVFWAYIKLYTTENTQSAKYYSNESIDANDSYRKQLVSLVAKSAGEEERFTERVLNYIYEGWKRGVIPSTIRRPRDCKKFYDANFFYNGMFKDIFSVTDSMLSALGFAAKALENLVISIGKSAQEALDGIGSLVENVSGAASWLMKNIVWIAGGVLVIGGVVIYKNRDTVKELAVGKLKKK